MKFIQLLKSMKIFSGTLEDVRRYYHYVDINGKNNHGDTALHEAAYYGKEKIL